jgi:hypothetical protein
MKFEGFFRQITSPNVIASQVKLTELFEILLTVRQTRIQNKQILFYF